MNELIIAMLGSGCLGSILTAIVQHFLNKRKETAEVSDKELDNQKKADELQELRIQKLNETINLLQRQIDLMLVSNVKYTTIINELYQQTCAQTECRQRQYMSNDEFRAKLLKKEEEE